MAMNMKFNDILNYSGHKGIVVLETTEEAQYIRMEIETFCYQKNFSSKMVL